jgi:SAM-dependent methyltransferase
VDALLHRLGGQGGLPQASGAMDERYWDNAARQFDDEIFNVVGCDENSVIPSIISKHASNQQIATDCGCGVGRTVPLLASAFKQVHAVDFSAQCLQVAEETCGHLENVTFDKVDLSAPQVSLPRSDFAVCINTVIMASLKKRLRILENVGRHIRRGGHLLLVVPSLESALFTQFRLNQWHRRDVEAVEDAPHETLDALDGPKASLPDGVLSISGVPTKHYVKEEVCVLLRERRLRPTSVRKVEYSWKTEFDEPPRWMKEPYPWDWAVVAQKT